LPCRHCELRSRDFGVKLIILRAIDGKDGHDEHKRAKKRNNVYIKEVEPLPTPIWAEHARIKSEADLANTADTSHGHK
jgi:predicted metal-dependent RNase